jgi:hypothetical protein
MVKKERITCDICGKSFDSRKQMNQHKHDVHDDDDDMVNDEDRTKKQEVTKSYGKRSSKKKLSKKLIVIIIGVGILIAITGGIGSYYYTMGSKSSSSASRLTIDGIQCNPIEHVAFHIHTHLDIFINGKPSTVPSQIGIKPDERCLYWLHTHDETGIIHVEAPEKRDFTLGQFFDIWNEKFSNSQIFNYTTGSGGADDNNSTLTVYVNGHKISGMSYRDIKLNAHDEIAIVYGSPQTQQPTTTIPSNYAFPKGL